MRNENDRNIFNEFNCATLKVRYTFLIRRAFFFRRRRSEHPFPAIRFFNANRKNKIF